MLFTKKKRHDVSASFTLIAILSAAILLVVFDYFVDPI